MGREMLNKTILYIACAAVLVSGTSVVAAPQAESGFTPIFDGKSLDGVFHPRFRNL